MSRLYPVFSNSNSFLEALHHVVVQRARLPVAAGDGAADGEERVLLVALFGQHKSGHEAPLFQLG